HTHAELHSEAVTGNVQEHRADQSQRTIDLYHVADWHVRTSTDEGVVVQGDGFTARDNTESVVLVIVIQIKYFTRYENDVADFECALDAISTRQVKRFGCAATDIEGGVATDNIIKADVIERKRIRRLRRTGRQ